MGFKRTAAGKTGTTNDKRDAWFIGFTPHTLALTWVGFDDNSPTGLSGSDGAVPVWTRYMQAITVGQPDSAFPAPGGITFAEMDETTGGLATPYCPPNAVVNQAFKAGTEPYSACPLHHLQPPPMPMVDQFGNPIDPALTATDMTSAMPPLPADTPPPLAPIPAPAEPAVPTVQPPAPPTQTAPPTDTAPRTDTAPPPTTTT
jgi:membrane peptidoglycan carboxypeptidase